MTAEQRPNPSLEELFHPRGPRPQAYDTHRERRQNLGGMSTRRQREEAARRAEAERAKKEFRIDWNDTENWYTPNGGGPIAGIDHGFLWDTLCWLIRNDVAIFRDYNHGWEGRDTVELAAKLWLRDRPAVRALVKEAIRNNITLPPDVFRFCKDYMLDRKGTLDGYVPWADPNLRHQPEALKGFLNQPLVSAEMEEGRLTRAIDL